MSIKDLSTAWDKAAHRALEINQEAELPPDQLASAAGMHVRTGVAAGGAWGLTDGCGCRTDCPGSCPG